MLLQDRHHLRRHAALFLALLCCLVSLCACQKEDEPSAAEDPPEISTVHELPEAGMVSEPPEADTVSEPQTEDDVSTPAQAEENGPVRHDYNELLGIVEELENYFANHDQSDAEYMIWGYAIDGYNHCIEVSMNSADQAAIDWFKENVCASDCITFKQGDPIIALTVRRGAGQMARPLGLLSDNFPERSVILRIQSR